MLPMAGMTAVPALIRKFIQPVVMLEILLVLCAARATLGAGVPWRQPTQYLVIPVVEHTNISRSRTSALIRHSSNKSASDPD